MPQPAGVPSLLTRFCLTPRSCAFLRSALQAIQLRKELAALDLPADTLWVTSPLQRAMQTLLLACPHAHLLQPAGAAGGGEQPPSVMVLQSITEKVRLQGEQGRSKMTAWGLLLQLQSPPHTTCIMQLPRPPHPPPPR